jgi:DNA-binding NarL/FixJ family response regulator
MLTTTARSARSVSIRAPARVLIVDDALSVRLAVRALLEWRGYVIVGESGSATSAIEAVERLAPDAVVLDVRLGDDNGFDVARILTRARPELAVLLLSDDDYRSWDGLIEDSGARGFALKSELAKVDLEEIFGEPGGRSARRVVANDRH